MNFTKIVDKFRPICLESRYRYRHIACVLKGKKVIKYAQNNYDRQCIHGHSITSLHAEVGCMKFFRQLRKGFRLLILRFSKITGNLCDSRPCYPCKTYLLKKGITDIFCSIDNGTIKKIKLMDLKDYYSISTIKFINQNYNYKQKIEINEDLN